MRHTIVLALPEKWSERMAEILAVRLIGEMPEEVDIRIIQYDDEDNPTKLTEIDRT